jgi:hypothetical protein
MTAYRLTTYNLEFLLSLYRAIPQRSLSASLAFDLPSVAIPFAALRAWTGSATIQSIDLAARFTRPFSAAGKKAAKQSVDGRIDAGTLNQDPCSRQVLE